MKMIEDESVTTGEPGSESLPDESPNARVRKAGKKAASADRSLPEIVSSHLITLQRQHKAVLSGGSVEAIHKMRVATRRLQASLDLLQVKSNNLKTAKLKKQLRNWRRRLSSVRNYDVFLQLINTEVSSRRASHGAQFDSLVSILEQKRGARITEVQDYLAKISVPRLAARLGITIPTLSPPPEDKGGEEEAAETQAEPVPADLKKWPEESRIALRTADRIDQRLAEFQALADQAHATTHPRELHELRIAAKRLRYLLEVVSDQGYGDVSRALISLRTIQDKIGDWHDLEALENEIIDTVSRRKFLKNNLSESARMLLAAAHIEKKKSALVKRLFPIRVARSVPTASQRLARALRRSTLPAKARSEAPSQEAGEE